MLVFHIRSLENEFVVPPLGGIVWSHGIGLRPTIPPKGGTTNCAFLRALRFFVVYFITAIVCNEHPAVRAVRRLSLQAMCRSGNCRRRSRDRPDTSAGSDASAADETRCGNGTRCDRPRRSAPGAAASHTGTASATGCRTSPEEV